MNEKEGFIYDEDVSIPKNKTYIMIPESLIKIMVKYLKEKKFTTSKETEIIKDLIKELEK